MGHDQEAVRLARIERQALGRPVESETGAAEDEQVEIELARAPALAILAAEGALELLESDQQRGRSGRRVRAGRNVEADDRVPERWLVDHADRGRDVQPRHGAEADAGQHRERANPGREGRRRIPEVGAETDVRPDPSHRPIDLHR